MEITYKLSKVSGNWKVYLDGEFAGTMRTKQALNPGPGGAYRTMWPVTGDKWFGTRKEAAESLRDARLARATA